MVVTVTDPDETPATVDDLMPDPEAPQWVAIIRCEVCGEQGEMYSTHEPRDVTAWDCTACGTEDAIHHTVMASNTSAPLK